MKDGYPIRVFLRDTVTGFTHTYESEGWPEDGEPDSFNDFIWTDGNFCCDCNRWLLITEHGTIGPPELRDIVEHYGGRNTPSMGLPCNSARILIDKIERADTGAVVYTETVHP